MAQGGLISIYLPIYLFIYLSIIATPRWDPAAAAFKLCGVIIPLEVGFSYLDIWLHRCC